MPDVDLPGGTRLYTHLHAATPLLLTRAPHPSDQVKTLTWDGPSTLLRPDGHVVWVEDLGEAAFRTALDMWC